MSTSHFHQYNCSCNAGRRASGSSRRSFLEARLATTVEGARANGLLEKVGTLTPGEQADVVMLRGDRINVMPVNNVVGAVVHGMDTSNVDSVFVAGRARKRRGQLVGVDVDSLYAQVRASQNYLTSRLASKEG